MHMRQQITPITTSPPTLVRSVRSVRTDRTGSSGVVIQSSNWRVLASVYGHRISLEMDGCAIDQLHEYAN